VWQCSIAVIANYRNTSQETGVCSISTSRILKDGYTNYISQFNVPFRGRGIALPARYPDSGLDDAGWIGSYPTYPITDCLCAEKEKMTYKRNALTSDSVSHPGECRRIQTLRLSTSVSIILNQSWTALHKPSSHWLRLPLNITKRKVPLSRYQCYYPLRLFLCQRS
jgi:hypothetical protein